MIDISESQINDEEMVDAQLSKYMIHQVTISFCESLLHRQGARFIFEGIEFAIHPPTDKSIRKISMVKKNLYERELKEVDRGSLNFMGINPYAMGELARMFKKSPFYWGGLRFSYNNVVIEMVKYKEKFTSIAGGKADDTIRKPIQKESERGLGSTP